MLNDFVYACRVKRKYYLLLFNSIYNKLTNNDRWNNNSCLDDPPFEAPLEMACVNPWTHDVNEEEGKCEVQTSNSFLNDERLPDYDENNVDDVSCDCNEAVICSEVEGRRVEYLSKMSTHSKNEIAERDAKSQRKVVAKLKAQNL